MIDHENTNNLFLDWTKDPKGLLALLCFSFALKVLLLFLLDPISRDSARYIAAAFQFQSGHFRKAVSLYPLPAYPLLLALFHGIIPNWQLAALPTTLLASVLTLIPIYWITRDLFGEHAAFWAAATFAVSPYANRYGLYVIRDPSFLFTFAWALYFAHRFLQTKRMVFFSACGLLTVVAISLRVEGILFHPVFFVILLGTIAVDRDRMPYVKAVLIWCAIPLAIAGLLMILFPNDWLRITQADYLIHKIKNLFGRQLFENYNRISQDLRDLQVAHGYQQRGHNFFDLVRHYMPFVYQIGLAECFFRMLYPLFGIPLLLGLRTKPHRSIHLLWMTSFFFWVAGYIFILEENWISKRYLSPVVICLLPWVGLGMNQIIDWVRAKTSRPALSALAALFFFLIPTAQTVADHWKPEDRSLQKAGHWIAVRPELADKKIRASDNRILLYANRLQDFPLWGNETSGMLKSLTGMQRSKIVLIDNKTDGMPWEFKGLDHYKQIKVIKGSHNTITIYRRKK